MVNFSGIGRISAIKETENFKPITTKRFDSGWCKKTVMFNFSYGNFRTMFKAEYGYWGDKTGNIIPEKNTIYTQQSTGEKTELGKDIFESKKINYNDRLDKSLIDNAANYSKFIINTNNFNLYAVNEIVKRFEAGKEVSDADQIKYNVHSLEEAQALQKTCMSKVHEYIYYGDFVEAMVKLLSAPGIDKKPLSIRGRYEYSYNDQKDIWYKNFVPTIIEFVTETDFTERLNLTIDYLFTAGSYDDTEYNSTHTSSLNGYTRIYDNNYKNDACQGNIFAPIKITFKGDNDKQNEFMKKLLAANDNEYKTMQVTASYIEGAEKQNLSMDDLSPEQQEEIECGLTTFEQIAKEMGGGKFGDKIIDIRFVKYDHKKNIQPTDYTDADMQLPTHTQNNSKHKVADELIKDDLDDIFNDDLNI